MTYGLLLKVHAEMKKICEEADRLQELAGL
jgi:hypothetical protein